MRELRYREALREAMFEEMGLLVRKYQYTWGIPASKAKYTSGNLSYKKAP